MAIPNLGLRDIENVPGRLAQGMPLRCDHMIPILCLAAVSFLPLQERTDVSRWAPPESQVLASVDSHDLDTRALHGFVSALLKTEEGLTTLLGPRATRSLQAALDFTKGWPDLPVGAVIQNLARGGILFGQVPSAEATAKGDGEPESFLILNFAKVDQAKQAADVLRTWLSLGERFGQGRELLESLVRDGSRLVYATQEGLRRGILDRIRGKQELSPARFSQSFFGGRGGSLLRLRLWADISQSLDEKNFESNKDEPLGAMLLAGLFDGIEAAGQYRFRADLAGGAEPRLSLRLDLPGFRKGLPPGALSVWTTGDSWLPASSEDQILRFRVARDFSALVKDRVALLSTRGQAELDKTLQGLEFGFQGAQAEKDILPDLAPGFSGLAVLGREENRVQEGPASYCLPQGLLAFGHKGMVLAKRVPSALRLFVVAGNSNRKRRGQDLYRVRSETQEGLALSVARIATRKKPRPLTASFEPCVASSESTLYVSSSPELCRSLFDAGEREPLPAAPGLTPGNFLEVQGSNLSLALLQNLDLARAQLVLRRGLSYARAEKRLRSIARLLAAAGRLSYHDGFRGEDLELALDWSPAPELFDASFWQPKRRESLR